MTREEHLLSCLAEECAEVAQRVSKALRFGLSEVQPGQQQTNAQRIEEELSDLIAVSGFLIREGIIEPPQPNYDGKREKIERFMAISRAQGVLQDQHK